MHIDSSASEASRLLASLVERSGVHYGREDSFKMSRGNLLPRRFMLGVPTRDLSVEGILGWCDALGMPMRCRAEFATHLHDANLILLGLEDSGARSVFKIYLEFWDKVREEVLRTGRTDPMLLHLGFKWGARDDGDEVRVARYTCYPLLSLHDTLRRIARIYDGAADRASRGVASTIVRQCANANRSESFIYVEVSEEGTARNSFDINLYKAGLRIADIHPHLDELQRYFAVPEQQYRHLLARVGARPLGHLSGGFDRSAEDFMTVYYETRPIDL